MKKTHKKVINAVSGTGSIKLGYIMSEKKSFLKKAGVTVKHLAIDSVVGTLATAHFLTEVSSQVLENVEASIKQRAYGEDKQQVIRERMEKSITDVHFCKVTYREIIDGLKSSISSEEAEIVSEVQGSIVEPI